MSTALNIVSERHLRLVGPATAALFLLRKVAAGERVSDWMLNEAALTVCRLEAALPPDNSPKEEAKRCP